MHSPQRWLLSLPYYHDCCRSPFQDPFQNMCSWMMLLKCNIVTSTANLHLREGTIFYKYHSSLQTMTYMYRTYRVLQEKKPMISAAIFTKNVSLFIINQKRLRCSIYPAQKILLKIQKLKRNPWWTHEKSQFQTIFHQTSISVERLVTDATWVPEYSKVGMIQGQKFTVKDKTQRWSSQVKHEIADTSSKTWE